MPVSYGSSQTRENGQKPRREQPPCPSIQRMHILLIPGAPPPLVTLLSPVDLHLKLPCAKMNRGELERDAFPELSTLVTHSLIIRRKSQSHCEKWKSVDPKVSGKRSEKVYRDKLRQPTQNLLDFFFLFIILGLNPHLTTLKWGSYFPSVGTKEGVLNRLMTISPVVEYCEWLSVVKNPYPLPVFRNPLLHTNQECQETHDTFDNQKK